jgi:hypothetical protein
MRMNVEKKTNTMRISQQSSPVQITTGQKKMENVEYFNYLGSFITSYARSTCKIKDRISITKWQCTRRLLSPAK